MELKMVMVLELLLRLQHERAVIGWLRWRGTSFRMSGQTDGGWPVRMKPITGLESSGGGSGSSRHGTTVLLQIVPGGCSRSVMSGKCGWMGRIGRMSGKVSGVRE